MKKMVYISICILILGLLSACNSNKDISDEEKVNKEILLNELNDESKEELKILSKEYNDIVFGETMEFKKIDNTKIYEDDKLEIIFDFITVSKEVGPVLSLTSKNLANYDIEYKIKYVKINGINISEPLSNLEIKAKHTYTDTIALLPKGLNKISNFKEVNELGFLLQVYNADTNELLLNNKYFEYINEKVNSYDQDLSIKGELVKGKEGINIFIYKDYIDAKRKGIFIGIDNKSNKNIYGFSKKIKINEEIVPCKLIINTPKDGKSYGKIYIEKDIDIDNLKKIEIGVGFIDIDNSKLIERLKYSN